MKSKKNSNKKKVLITGGAGFIGHHIIKEILNNWQYPDTGVVLERF